MIFDTLKNLPAYRNLAPQAVELLLEALPGFSADSPNGKTVLIEDKLFILIQRYESFPPAEGNYEVHRNFVDLQMLLDGKEEIYYTGNDTLECTKPYDAEKDFAMYAVDENKTILTMEPGNFAIFLPEEKHLPGRGDGSKVVKAVIKIHRSLIAG